MFLIHKRDGSDLSLNVEYLPCGAVTPKVGMTMNLSGGSLVGCTGTNKPNYVCLSAAAKDGMVQVMRVHRDMVFQTEWSAAASSIKLGNKVTIDGYGLAVTATTTDGVAEVVAIEGTAVGDKCYVRFP